MLTQHDKKPKAAVLVLLKAQGAVLVLLKAQGSLCIRSVICFLHTCSPLT